MTYVRAAAGSGVVGFAVLLAAGCDAYRLPDSVHPTFTDPALRHPIVIATGRAILELPVIQASSADQTHLILETIRFARNYRREARGPLTITYSGHHHAIGTRLKTIRNVLDREGVPATLSAQSSRTGYGSEVITLSYDRIAALGPTCGDWSEDVTRNPENLPYPNFGCAAQRNLANMVANPTDLAVPARGSETTSDQAATVKKYRQDTTTTAPSVTTTK